MSATYARISKTTEHDEQVTVVSWARMRESRYPALRLLFAVPNAAKRSPRLAARMKAEGLKPGVPDLLLPVARQGFTGLAIEMKRDDGRVSDEQQAWLEALEGEGWKAAVCWSAGEAIEMLEGYVA